MHLSCLTLQRAGLMSIALPFVDLKNRLAASAFEEVLLAEGKACK